MMTRQGTAIVAVILALILCGFTLEAAQRRNQDREQEQATQVVGPRAETEEEATAFEAIQSETNPSNRVTLADNFLATYPESELSGYIQRFRMEGLLRLGRYTEAVAAGEAGLDLEIKFMEQLIAEIDAAANDDNRNRNDSPPIDRNSPEFRQFAEQMDQTIMYYYQQIMNAYQQLNDAPKILEWGEKALGHNPGDLFTLLTLSSVMAERPPEDEAEREQHLRRAEELGEQALSAVNTLLSGAANVSAEQRNSLLAGVHSTLGLIYLNQEKYGDSQEEYMAAIEAKNDDPISYFRLGLAYAQQDPPKVDEALDVLAKSVYLKGVTEQQARNILEQLYKAKNNDSVEGLDEFVQDAGQNIGR